MKFLLIGPGRMGKIYARIFNELGAELLAICGNTEETTRKNGSAFAVPLFFHNQWEEMLDAFPEADFVVIASSEWAHLKPFLAVAKRKKNILIEKPICISLSDALQMQDAVIESGIFVMPCFTCRFDARYQAAFLSLAQLSGEKIQKIETKRNTDLSTASRVIGKMPMAFWLLPHDIDVVRWYTQDEVKSVRAFFSPGENQAGILKVELWLNNGATANLECMWMDNPTNEEPHSVLEIRKENAVIEVDLVSNPVMLREGLNVKTSPWIYDGFEIYGKLKGASTQLCEHFLDVIQHKAEPVISFHDGFQSISVCDAIHKSIDLGKIVEVNSK